MGLVAWIKTDDDDIAFFRACYVSVFIESHNIKQVVPLWHYATAFQAEVYAIRICVLYLCDEVNASIAICSDSQAALKALAAAKTT